MLPLLHLVGTPQIFLIREYRSIWISMVYCSIRHHYCWLLCFVFSQYPITPVHICWYVYCICIILHLSMNWTAIRLSFTLVHVVRIAMNIRVVLWQISGLEYFILTSPPRNGEINPKHDRFFQSATQVFAGNVAKRIGQNKALICHQSCRRAQTIRKWHTEQCEPSESAA